MSHLRRAKQRIFLFYAGITTLLAGVVLFLFVVIMAGFFNTGFRGMTEVGSLSIFLVGLGGVLSVVFARIGWNNSIILDLLLNQFSIVITIIGFTGLAIEFIFRKPETSSLLFVFLILTGVILASLGMKYSTPPEGGQVRKY
jgi:hypothetical protein